MGISDTHFVCAVCQICRKPNDLSQIAVIIGRGSAKRLWPITADEHEPDRRSVTRLEAAAAYRDGHAGLRLRDVEFDGGFIVVGISAERRAQE